MLLNKGCIIGLKAHSTRRKYCLLLENLPQLSWTSDIINLLIFAFADKCSSYIHQGNSLQQRNNIIENHNWSKSREQSIIGCLAPVDTSTAQLLQLRLREHWGRVGWTVRSKRPGNDLITCWERNKVVTFLKLAILIQKVTRIKPLWVGEFFVIM